MEPLGQSLTHGGAVAIGPGRFDEHSPKVRVAGLGDRPVVDRMRPSFLTPSWGYRISQPKED